MAVEHAHCARLRPRRRRARAPRALMSTGSILSDRVRVDGLRDALLSARLTRPVRGASCGFSSPGTWTQSRPEAPRARRTPGVPPPPGVCSPAASPTIRQPSRENFPGLLRRRLARRLSRDARLRQRTRGRRAAARPGCASAGRGHRGLHARRHGPLLLLLLLLLLLRGCGVGMAPYWFLWGGTCCCWYCCWGGACPYCPYCCCWWYCCWGGACPYCAYCPYCCCGGACPYPLVCCGAPYPFCRAGGACPYPRSSAAGTAAEEAAGTAAEAGDAAAGAAPWEL